MKKNDKKIENSLRVQLTKVCDQALEELIGFEWLTHHVNYDRFPNSLKIICVFQCDEDIKNMINIGKDKWLYSLIKDQLADIKIELKKVSNHTVFDSEQRCEVEHHGRWNERINGRYQSQRELH